MSALIAWLGTQTGFINEPQSHLTCYHNPRINPREHGLNFNGEAYLCIPVDGDGGARTTLDKAIDLIGIAYTHTGDYTVTDADEKEQAEVLAILKEWQAMLPGESEVEE